MTFSESGKVALLGAVLVFLIVGALGHVVRHDFVDFDDGTYVTDNSNVLRGLTWKGVVWAFTTRHANNWHPLTWLSLMSDATFFGKKAAGFHLTSLLLHMTNSILLFLLLWWLTNSVFKSWLVAALFAIHPLHVESVAWVSERKDVLSAFFWMLVLLSYAKYVELQSCNSRLRWIGYLATLLLFALGLMAKPMLVTLPFVLILFDLWPLRRLKVGLVRDTDESPPSIACRSECSLRLLVAEKMPFVLLSSLSCAVTLVAQGRAVSRFESFPLGIRVANALVSYVAYIGKMFWPVSLSPFYIHPGMGLPVWLTVASGVVLSVVTGFALWQVARRPYLATGWFWYLVTLVPVIGLVQVGAQGMADRYTYLPLTGLFVMIVWGIGDITQGCQRGVRVISSFLASIAVVVILVLAFRAHIQAEYWRDTITLFERALVIAPDNYVAHNNLGIALEKLGKLDEALFHYTKAAELRPSHAQAHNNLGNIFLRQGKLDKAIEEYYEALKYRPDDPIINNNLGYALARKGKRDIAVQYYQRALAYDPHNARAHLNLGCALLREGKLQEAISHLSEAEHLQPRSVRVHVNLGVALQLAGKQDEAMKHFQTAVKLDPRSPDAHLNLGVALFKKGDVNGASREFAQVIELRPSDPRPYEYLAVSMYHAGRYDEARAAVEMLRKLGGKPDPALVSALSGKKAGS